VIAFEHQVVKARAIRPLPEAESWRREALEMIAATPWDPTPEVNPDAPAQPQVIPAAPDEVHDEPVRDDRHAPRATPVRQADVTRWGYTKGCRKCEAMRNNDRTQPTLGHSAACRARITEEMRKDPELSRKLEEATNRMNDYKERKAFEKARGGEDPQLPKVKAPPAPQMSEGAAASGSSSTAPTAGTQSAGAAASGSSSTAPTAGTQSTGRKRRGEDLDDSYTQERVEQARAHRSKRKQDFDQDTNMMSCQLCSLCDVSEIFSPPRVVPHAQARGLRPGWSLDLNAADPTTGRIWDL